MSLDKFPDSLSVQENVYLHKYTTYKVGGMAKWFASPSNEADLVEIWTLCKKHEIPLFVLGKGSNVVVSDQGFPGMILYTGEFSNLSVEGDCIQAEAGALLHSMVSLSVKSGLAGLQNLGGIPGTVGGGVYINAGAFDQELVQTCIQVKSVDALGQVKVRRGDECGFSYRHSNFFAWDELILQARFQLQKASSQEMQAQMTDILKRRKKKQPLQYPNAGSMYKRPTGTYAGKLIQEANLKGFSVGGAAISEHHANFVINTGQAKAQDIYDLSEEVVIRVKENSGILLEKEQIFVGFFERWPR